jgi:UDP-N-acetylglucosamine 2-epimerase
VPTHAGYLQIAVVVGTRLEIVRVAPIVRMLGSNARFLHTGQHTDTKLSDVFLEAARLPSRRSRMVSAASRDTPRSAGWSNGSRSCSRKGHQRRF